jgi:hypothetical protein
MVIISFIRIIPHHKKVYHRNIVLSSDIFNIEITDEISGIIISMIEHT